MTATVRRIEGPWVPVGGKTFTRGVIEERRYPWAEHRLPVPIVEVVESDGLLEQLLREKLL